MTVTVLFMQDIWRDCIERDTMHSIFKISISRNMKCEKMVGFLKYSHNCWLFNKILLKGGYINSRFYGSHMKPSKFQLIITIVVNDIHIMLSQ